MAGRLDDTNDFSDNEIKLELSRLGYHDISDDRLQEFKNDLNKLIKTDKGNRSSQNTSASSGLGRDTTNYQAVPRDRVPLEDSPLQNGVQYTSLGNKEKSRQIPSDHYAMYGKENYRDPALRDDVSESGSERRFVKRKTLRKPQQGARYIDESVTESDTSSILDIDERLCELGINDDMLLCKRPQSSRSEPPYRLNPDDPRPASVILRPQDPTKIIKKNDPVSRYHKFRESWSSFRAPGENTHKDLRWSIREQMAVQDVIEKKPHRVFMSNKYVVPSEKQRKSLRWQVRMDMAHGNMPANGPYDPYS